MVRRKNAEKELQWREILDRQAGSGFSIREFCAREGISQPSFYAWRKKLRERPAETARRPEQPAGDAQLFVPLQLLDPSGSLEIVHPRGYRIQVTGDVNPVALRHVIEALEERGAP